jgi:hypothetical protein
MRFSVCVAATRASTLESTLRAIGDQWLTDWEAIVIGQADDREVRSALGRVPMDGSRLRYVHIDRPGLSRARNAAMSVARGDLLAFTDDDCEPSPDWLLRLNECFLEDPRVGAVGGSLLQGPRPPGSRFASCPANRPADAIYDPASNHGRPPAGWDLIGANFALSRTTVERVGDFDECLGAGSTFPSAEETDYKLRMEAHDVRMRSTPDAVVYHTYGWRTGPRAVLAQQRGYARGNGALAGKLTLLGDPRGREWLKVTGLDAATRWLRTARPHRLVIAARRFAHFWAGYRECVRGHVIDPRGMLAPKDGTAPGVARSAARPDGRQPASDRFDPIPLASQRAHRGPVDGGVKSPR